MLCTVGQTGIPCTIHYIGSLLNTCELLEVICHYFYCEGSQVVHEKAPHIKSLMIAGPRGVGKKMLVHAVCTETGSSMFDLTPTSIAAATRYAGKAGLNMLLHMVFKVSEFFGL